MTFEVTRFLWDFWKVIYYLSKWNPITLKDMKHTKLFNLLVCAVTLLAAGQVAEAGLSVKYPCSDGMVLQQKTDALVWGHADAGRKVEVRTSWDGRSYAVKADSKGVWKIKVRTPEASYTNYEITVTGDGETLTIKDVLVGEVWIASGQSNMEMPLRGFFNCPVEGSQLIASAPAMPDRIRMFTVNIYQPDDPIDDVHETRGWEKAGPEAVLNMSATAYFFASKLNSLLDVPVGIVACPRGGASVESWLPKETLAAWGDDVSKETIDKQTEWTQSYRMYNGMQHPIQGYTAKGFIWYQGCTNVGRDEQFVTRMTELVRQWRQDWGDKKNEMPFYMCEIAPYLYTGDQAGKASALRAAQHKASKVIPNSAIIVTNDLAYSYERHNIHPCQKEPVGRRLAYLALNRDYGFKTIACYSPEATEAFVREGLGSEVCIRLTNCPNGMNRELEIEGLEACGRDGIWVPVSFAYCEGSPQGAVLRIRSAELNDIREVRYGWGDFNPGNLANAEGLPVTPFWLKVE